MIHGHNNIILNNPYTYVHTRRIGNNVRNSFLRIVTGRRYIEACIQLKRIGIITYFFIQLNVGHLFYKYVECILL